MSDFKSKLPDLKELASMTSKLYTDIKKSVGEIVQSYKENRAEQAEETEKAEQTNVAPVKEAKPKKTVEESASAEPTQPVVTPEEPKTDDTKQ
ncbi:hypothetical protein OQJ19_13585 [Fluoribacter gormanii]|uniref:Uncharacterized protein n=1 Tax=Fluoribacter gormanii TaxID=464 RepID=A0A377GKD5_9GAMM|nr:hypothetical protein [Fluoribacter gormanii]KTD02534.1 hypothetical protein Lgor_1826 [Fluoribacter gormanii]MCW8471669.1 hypothetical protein [Fluoribacter gormanii]SIR44287.1 hypothetical protein SAMN05421777_11254 [Fluoribacter gormanii]STO25218.1 Uncharacterised protein [Fluoribacter gormanii]